MVGAVGDDAYGGQMTANLAEAGVDVSRVTTVPGRSTGTALIVVAADGENTVVVAPGANAALAVGPLEFAAGDVLLLQLEVPLATSLAAARSARAAGARVVLNAAPLTKPDDTVLDQLLDLTDVLVVNETEAAGLSGMDGSGEPGSVAGWQVLARRLPGSATVITLGGRGRWPSTVGGRGGSPPSPRRSWTPPAPETRSAARSPSRWPPPSTSGRPCDGAARPVRWRPAGSVPSRRCRPRPSSTRAFVYICRGLDRGGPGAAEYGGYG